MSVSDVYESVKTYMETLLPAGGRYDTPFVHAIGGKEILSVHRHFPSADWVLGEQPDDFTKDGIFQSNSPKMRVTNRRISIFDIYIWGPSIQDIEQEEIVDGDTDAYGNDLTPRPPGLLHYYIDALHRFGGTTANLQILEGQWAPGDITTMGAAYRLRVQVGFNIIKPRPTFATVTEVTQTGEIDNG